MLFLVLVQLSVLVAIILFAWPGSLWFCSLMTIATVFFAGLVWALD